MIRGRLAKSPIYGVRPNQLILIACDEQHDIGGGYTYYVALKKEWIHKNDKKVESDQATCRDWKTLLPSEFEEIAINCYVCRSPYKKAVGIANSFSIEVTQHNFNK
jgi:hypothetical protein